jgi:hypothetical protein
MQTTAPPRQPPVPPPQMLRQPPAGDRTRARTVAALEWRYLPWMIVAVGVVLRLARYLHDKSLWLDESYLALNLMRRSFHGLTETLDWNQGAPLGFLFSEKAALRLFGDSEYSLRLLPLIAGVASVFVFYAAAKPLLSRGAFLIALLLFATLEPFIYYAAELKQYELDVLATVSLLAVFAHVAGRRPLSPKRALAPGRAGRSRRDRAARCPACGKGRQALGPAAGPGGDPPADRLHQQQLEGWGHAVRVPGVAVRAAVLPDMQGLQRPDGAAASHLAPRSRAWQPSPILPRSHLSLASGHHRVLQPRPSGRLRKRYPEARRALQSLVALHPLFPAVPWSALLSARHSGKTCQMRHGWSRVRLPVRRLARPVSYAFVVKLAKTAGHYPKQPTYNRLAGGRAATITDASAS